MTGPDSKDFEALLRTHSGFIMSALRTYERDPGLRDDLYQEVAVALWRAIKGFRGDASMKTFIARITHNIGVSHIRKATRHAKTGELDNTIKSDAPNPEEIAETSSKRRHLMRAIDDLPLGQRQALTLHLDGFSITEIGDILGISDGNVSVRLNRARTTLTNSKATQS